MFAEMVIFSISNGCCVSIRNVADIMDTEEQEDQKIRMSARNDLNRVSGTGKVCTVCTTS